MVCSVAARVRRRSRFFRRQKSLPHQAITVPTPLDGDKRTEHSFQPCLTFSLSPNVAPSWRGFAGRTTKTRRYEWWSCLGNAAWSDGGEDKLHSGGQILSSSGNGVALFVDGCFWHRHPYCKFSYIPKSRRDFWLPKFARTITRDRIVTRTLKRAGWKVVRIWECELNEKDATRPMRRIRRALTKPKA